MPYPLELEFLHKTLTRLPGVHDVCCGIDSLHHLVAADLAFPDFRHLPHGALRRTGGGLENEALIQIEFKIHQTPLGWRSLEFIAWFVRDQARGGVSVQLRPFALPPQIGESVQLGNTLRWHIDLFCSNVTEDLSPQLAQVHELANGLRMAVDIYGHLFPADV